MEWAVSILITSIIFWVGYCIYDFFVYYSYYYFKNFEDYDLKSKIVIIIINAVLIGVLILVFIFLVFFIKIIIFRK